MDKKLMQEAKESFAARHNKTWQDIEHDFEIGGGISKVMDEFAVMESVAEIYAKKKYVGLIEEIDGLLGQLEDSAHGQEGKDITTMRGKIVASLK